MRFAYILLYLINTLLYSQEVSEDGTRLDYSSGMGSCLTEGQEIDLNQQITKYPDLKFLRLCGKIEEIPSVVFSLKHLEELDVRWNTIEEIPKCLVPQSCGVRYNEIKGANLWEVYYTLTPRPRLACEKKYKKVWRAPLS